MEYRRVLTVQDVSCVGQCSLTVALPILSACGLETAVIPSAVLSTHTAFQGGYTFRDLTEDIPAIAAHWKREGITFDAVYSGYLGSEKQIAYVKDVMDEFINENGVRVADPAMADNGKLYAGFDMDFVAAMRSLAFSADVILPNITEACLLTGEEYREKYDESYVRGLLEKLTKGGAKSVVLTGVSYDDSTTGVVVLEKGNTSYYRHLKYPKGSHGTGDVYASAFVGAMMRGKTLFDSAVIAADYTLKCIEATKDDESHWYGVKFEPVLPELIKRVCD